MTELQRPKGTGSVYQECTPTCPPLEWVTDDDGVPRKVRPEHKCPGRWVGTYEAGWSKKGTRRRPKVTGKTKAIVKAKLRDKLREAEAAEAATTGGKPTVKRWADVWLEERVTSVRPKTWATDRSQVRNAIVPAIGHRRLEQLGPADIRAVHRAMHNAEPPSSPSSIVRAHATLVKMLKDAVMAGHKVPQGALLVDGPDLGGNGRDAIPLDDAVAILAAASKRPDASRWVAALLQAMRPAECMGLTWDMVDLDEATITVAWQMRALPYKEARKRDSGFRVPIGFESMQLDGATHLVRPKTSAGWRIVPLVPWMKAALTAWREVAPNSPHGLVWPGYKGADERGKQDRAAWREVCAAAGVDPAPDLYAARHTTATLLRKAKVDPETITAIMGHASILSTQAYLHTDSTRTRAALESIAATLGLGAAES